MYENITYAELKNLPKEQKFDAWKELKTLYSTQKELAEKLGVSPAIVSNMISKYNKDESAKRKKPKKLEVIDNPKKSRKRVKKQETHENQEQQEPVAVVETKPVVPEILVMSEGNDVESESFSISIKKLVSGEDAQYFLNGLGSTLLKNRKYSIEIRITEK